MKKSHRFKNEQSGEEKKYRRLAKCNRRRESRSHRMINYGKYYNAKEDKDYINNSRKPFSVH